MKLRNLGKNGFKVSEIGLGCWQMGGGWGKEISKAKAFDIMEEAVKNGITFFDTADVYGAGRSECFIGEFIKETNATIKITTKFGRADNVFPDNYSEKALRETVNNSLENLGVPFLDLLQLHCVPLSVLKDGAIFNWVRALKKEGKIKAFGASVETIEEGLVCIEESEISSIQVIFNIFRQKLSEELLPKCKEKGVGVIVRLPLASGVLTGKFTKATKFLENDHRNFNKDGDAFNVGETFAGVPFELGVELSDTIKEHYLPKESSMVQFALRWILDHDAVSCIIPGASSSSHIIQNAATSDMPSLSPKTHQLLSDFYNDKIKDNVRGAY